MSVCVKPLHTEGRCRDVDGRTWENTHPVTQREADAVALADRAVRERDAALAGMKALTDTNAVLSAVLTLTVLHLETDEWGPDEFDRAEAAARVLAPSLLGVTE